MEIERKYLIEAAEMPENCLSYPFLQIEQAYLSVDPQAGRFLLSHLQIPRENGQRRVQSPLKRPVLRPSAGKGRRPGSH